MKFLKNRVVAVLISLAIVISSTLISTNAKLGRRCEKISDGFYEGVTYNGTERKSIASQLRVICSAMDSLAAISDEYGIDGDGYTKMADIMRSSLSYSSVSENYDAYSELSSAFNKLSRALSSADLSEQDRSEVDQCILTVSGAQQAIEDSGYNESVREFCREQLRFPADVLGNLAGVAFPQLFE